MAGFDGQHNESTNDSLPRERGIRRRWRDYATASGRRPVRDFIRDLSVADGLAVAAAMLEVARIGLRAARHVRGDVHEVRAVGENRTYRILFAGEGRFGQVLLALEAFTKKTRKTPEAEIDLAMERSRDWRERGGHGGHNGI